MRRCLRIAQEKNIRMAKKSFKKILEQAAKQMGKADADILKSLKEDGFSGKAPDLVAVLELYETQFSSSFSAELASFAKFLSTKSEDDIFQLAAIFQELLGAPPKQKQEDYNAAQTQAEIDALLSGDLDDEPVKEPEAPKKKETKEEDSGAQSQEDIDALLEAAAEAENEPEIEEDEEVNIEADRTPQEQADIDSLLEAAAAQADAEMNEVDEDAEEEPESTGPQSQGDIDALLEAAAAEADKALSGEDEEHKEEEDSGPQSQDDIDALLEAAAADADEEFDFDDEDVTDHANEDEIEDAEKGAEEPAQESQSTEKVDSAPEDEEALDDDLLHSQEVIDALLAESRVEEEPAEVTKMAEGFPSRDETLETATSISELLDQEYIGLEEETLVDANSIGSSGLFIAPGEIGEIEASAESSFAGTKQSQRDPMEDTAVSLLDDVAHEYKSSEGGKAANRSTSYVKTETDTSGDSNVVRVIEESFILRDNGKVFYEGTDSDKVKSLLLEKIVNGKADNISLVRTQKREVLRVESVEEDVSINIEISWK